MKWSLLNRWFRSFYSRGTDIVVDSLLHVMLANQRVTAYTNLNHMFREHDDFASNTNVDLVLSERLSTRSDSWSSSWSFFVTPLVLVKLILLGSFYSCFLNWVHALARFLVRYISGVSVAKNLLLLPCYCLGYLSPLKLNQVLLAQVLIVFVVIMCLFLDCKSVLGALSLGVVRSCVNWVLFLLFHCFED